MSLTATTIPAQTRSKREPTISAEEMKKALKLLHGGQVVSDDVLYDQPSRSGKVDPRTMAYYAGHRVREEVLAADDNLTARELTIKTWADGDGFRWGLRIK